MLYNIASLLPVATMTDDGVRLTTDATVFDTMPTAYLTSPGNPPFLPGPGPSIAAAGKMHFSTKTPFVPGGTYLDAAGNQQMLEVSDDGIGIIIQPPSATTSLAARNRDAIAPTVHARVCTCCSSPIWRTIVPVVIVVVVVAVAATAAGVLLTNRRCAK